MYLLISNISIDNILRRYELWLHLVRLLEYGTACARQNSPLLLIECFNVGLNFVELGQLYVV